MNPRRYCLKAPEASGSDRKTSHFSGDVRIISFFREHLVKTINLLLSQPVTLIIQLVSFNIRILQKGDNIDIGMVSFSDTQRSS